MAQLVERSIQKRSKYEKFKVSCYLRKLLSLMTSYECLYLGMTSSSKYVLALPLKGIVLSFDVSQTVLKITILFCTFQTGVLKGLLLYREGASF